MNEKMAIFFYCVFIRDKFAFYLLFLYIYYIYRGSVMKKKPVKLRIRSIHNV